LFYINSHQLYINFEGTYSWGTNQSLIPKLEDDRFIQAGKFQEYASYNEQLRKYIYRKDPEAEINIFNIIKIFPAKSILSFNDEPVHVNKTIIINGRWILLLLLL